MLRPWGVNVIICYDFVFALFLFDRFDVALDGFNVYALDGLNYLNVTPQMGSMFCPWLVSQCHALDVYGLLVIP